MLLLLRILAPLLLLLSSTAALAHPFLDVQPFPIATVESGTNYVLTLKIFPGDTAVQSMQLDFEMSSAGAFGAPSPSRADRTSNRSPNSSARRPTSTARRRIWRPSFSRSAGRGSSSPR